MVDRRFSSFVYCGPVRLGKRGIDIQASSSALVLPMREGGGCLVCLTPAAASPIRPPKLANQPVPRRETSSRDKRGCIDPSIVLYVRRQHRMHASLSTRSNRLNPGDDCMNTNGHRLARMKSRPRSDQWAWTSRTVRPQDRIRTGAACLFLGCTVSPGAEQRVRMRDRPRGIPAAGWLSPQPTRAHRSSATDPERASHRDTCGPPHHLGTLTYCRRVSCLLEDTYVRVLSHPSFALQQAGPDPAIRAYANESRAGGRCRRSASEERGRPCVQALVSGLVSHGGLDLIGRT